MTGGIFFGAATRGLGHAFELGVVEFAGVGLAIAALSLLLPAGGRRAAA